ncbi:hypothetical protein FA13DRAFT_1730083 [Coprinellus micaceus]|uniref:Nephrocystin 3-like N-terminal domain-containing protein n=1 Tax=Coprinellus micaceus TaxID=71717 RepID=A0A4Y7TIG8_COPMI|nr:hypothetical protein FA13DRAFT_1730083 [Coprinellus micaceus]
MSSSTSYLEGAHHNRFESLTITHVAGSAGKSAVEYLEEHIAFGAIHNSGERCDAPTWITHGDRDDIPTQLMWISGPAGTGKTAIAGSVAETCHEKDILAASFFFSSYGPSPERSSKRYLVPTLVYQLLQHEGLEALEEGVAAAIRRDKAIFKKRLKDQFEALILKPLRRVKGQLNTDIPQVIIIDGVDEVKVEKSDASSRHTAPRRDEDDHLEIVSCLLHAAKDPAFPFRIIIISRPERVFTDFFSTQAAKLSKQLFLDDKYHPDSDIRLYLTSSFAELRRRYCLSPSWPGEEVIRYIVDRASGQFVYAATVIRFVASGAGPPPAQLDALFPLRPLRKNGAGRGLEALDALYGDILMTSPDPEVAAQWIHSIELWLWPAWVLALFLESVPGQGEHILRPLASLISIPDLANRSNETYRIYHKSLIDFLTEGNRRPKDLYRGFRGGLTLKAWLRLMTKKAPVTPLTELDENIFFSTLVADTDFLFYIPFAFQRSLEHFSETELLACDLHWWTSQIIERGNKSWISSHAVGILTTNHNICRKSDIPCRESCRKWSRCTFRAFVHHGWTMPSAELWQSYTNERDAARLNDLHDRIEMAFKSPHLY